MKRLRMELASEGAYNQVSFNYDGESEDQSLKEVNEAEKSDFKLPEKLQIPENIQLVSGLIIR